MQMLDVKKDFGADGNAVTNDRPAIDAAFAAAKAAGVGLYLPRGYYNYDLGGLPSTWDFADAQYGFTIEGDGLSVTEIRVSNPPPLGNPALYWTCSAGPQYDKVFKGFGLRGDFDGTVLTLGKNDLTDSFETSMFERVAVINQHAGGTQTEAVRLNYVLGNTFINSRFGCSADGLGNNYGTALRFRQACFNTFLNTDYGNAEMGVDFTDFGSWGNTFIGGGSENCKWNASIRTQFAFNNTWKGGRMSLWTQNAIRAWAGRNNSFENVAFQNGAGPATVLDPVNFAGVKIKDDIAVSTPAVPASKATITNTSGKIICVRIGGGVYTAVSINGFAMSKAANGDWTSWLLPPEQTIAVTYTSKPSWSWISPYW